MCNDNGARFNLLFTDCQKHINDIILLCLRPRRMKMFTNHLLEQNIHLIKNPLESSFSATKPINYLPHKRNRKKLKSTIASQEDLNFLTISLNPSPLNNFPKTILKITPLVRATDFLLRATDFLVRSTADSQEADYDIDSISKPTSCSRKITSSSY